MRKVSIKKFVSIIFYSDNNTASMKLILSGKKVYVQSRIFLDYLKPLKFYDYLDTRTQHIFRKFFQNS
jgi:hypothetical protein